MDPPDITKKPQCEDSVNITKNNQHMTTSYDRSHVLIF